MSLNMSEDIVLSKVIGNNMSDLVDTTPKSLPKNDSISSSSSKLDKIDNEGDDRPPKKMSDPGGRTEDKSKSRPTIQTETETTPTTPTTSTTPTSSRHTAVRTRTSSASNRSHSPRLNTSLSLDGADMRPLRFEIGPPVDPSYIGLQQERFSSIAYGGLSHHGLSRLSATSPSLNGSEFSVANEDSQSVLGVPIFDERSKKLEEPSLLTRHSSGELYGTPTSQFDVALPPLIPSSTATTPTTSGPGSLGSNGVRKKKSSWKNTLYPTYKSRSLEFKKLFTELPPEERLIVDFSCALQKDILVHGRLYSTINYLCFYANIFRCKTLIAIRWEDVTKVTKEKMALVFPNAIQISTKSDKHFFTSFAARDKTHTMLHKLWQNAQLDQPAPSAEMWQWVHSFYGEELGLTSDDEPDYVSPFGITPSSSLLACEDSPQFLHSRKLSKSATSPANLSDSLFENGANAFVVGANGMGNSSRSNTSSETGGARQLGKIEESGGCQNEAAEEEGSDGSPGLAGVRGRPSSLPVTADRQQQRRRVGVPSLQTTAGLNNNLSNLSASEVSDMSSESDSEFPQIRLNADGEDLLNGVKTDSGSRTRPRVTFDSWRASQDGREMTSQNFPVNVDTLFALLFTNSEFYIDFHTARKTLDFIQSPWQLKEDGSNDKIREVTFTLSLTNSMGYKHSQVTETQVMTGDSCSGQIYVVNVDTVNSGIPYAESFYVTSNFCLSRVSDNESNLCVVSAIKYKKAVWGLVKTFIEKNTWAGLEDFYSNLSRSLHIVATDLSRGNGAAKLSGKKVKKRSRASNNPLAFESTEAFSDVIDSEVLAAPSLIGIKRAGTSVMNGVLVGDYSPRPASSATIHAGGNAPSPINSFIVKIILILLSSLLVANVLLFFRLYNLEYRLTQPDGSDNELTPDPTLFFVKEGLPKSEDDWIKLVQRQEMLHQLELEKWHDLLGTATHLLRQTEESLTDLQRTIHPLALKKLRHLLFLQNFEPSIENLESLANQHSDQAKDVPKDEKNLSGKQNSSPDGTTIKTENQEL